jgi:hypothetical protein
MKVLLGMLMATLFCCLAAPAEEPLHFSRDIMPVLSKSCFTCHGPDELQRKAGLRLDLFESATAALPSGAAAIVPGNPDAGSLLARITAHDPADRMPPEGKGTPLTPQQVDLLRRWISEGATYEKHWSFVPPVQAEPPVPADGADRLRSPIDNFVFARLETEGLTPNPPADKEVLLRRAALDLTGLPPTREEMEAFLADTAPDAYEKQVDRLLDSPGFGERWAQVWLDLARYADTQGYEKDLRRTMWPFRDWVIKALNDDMPFDQFTREQIAGDLLEDPSRDQIVATGFHRNTMTNTEGGTDNEEFRTSAVIDRVNTTMQVWMGMTMGCAQCHTHKYDPISHKEYFEFYAFFNQSEDTDLDDDAPNLEVPTREQRRDRREASAKLADAQRELREIADAPPAEAPPAPVQGTWYRVGPFASESFEAAYYTDFGPEQGVDLASRYAADSAYWRSEPALNDTSGLTLEGENSAHYFYRTLETPQAMAVELSFGSDDGIKVWVNNVPVHSNNVQRGAVAGQDKVVAGLQPGVNTLLVKVVNGGASGALYASLAVQNLPPQIVQTLLVPEPSRTEDQRALLASYQDARQAIARWQARLDSVNKDIARMPVMKELPEDKRRVTRVFERGSFLSPGEEVQAATPAVFQSFPADLPRNRLGLAAWLTSRDNPLTARVIVNRYWEQLFGAGIVTTTEDFGTQGDWPTHPELLDWLAVEFMERDWSTKELCRMLVTSEVYRQSSAATPEKLEHDPYNRLYARGPRFRLPAESIRDQALEVAGLLSDKTYGPSVMPPQPDGLWQIEYSNDRWVESKGEDKFRRGVYTFWRRTDPYPSMVSFDAPSREVCTVTRVRTNTPLQALVTLNDPVFIEAAQALARRVVQEGGGSMRARGAFAFESILARKPAPDEVAVLVKLYRSEFEHYRNAPEEAEKMATIPYGPAGPEENAATLAAWTVVANTLMNTDEFLTKR